MGEASGSGKREEWSETKGFFNQVTSLSWPIIGLLMREALRRRQTLPMEYSCQQMFKVDLLVSRQQDKFRMWDIL